MSTKDEMVFDFDELMNDGPSSLQNTYARTERSVSSHVQERGQAGVHYRINTPIHYTQTRSLNFDPTILRRNRVIEAGSEDMIGASYKLLRTQVMQRMVANGWAVLGVVSPRMGAGSSTTALNLALAMAREANHTILLVDLDLRRPTIHQLLDHQPELGISDYLIHNVPLNRIMFNPGVDDLVIIPGRESIYNSSEALSSPKMVDLILEMRTRYERRLVIVNLPPALDSDDCVAFSPFLDCVLTVVEYGKTRSEELSRVNELLAHCNHVGVTLNKMPVRRKSRFHL